MALKYRKLSKLGTHLGLSKVAPEKSYFQSEMSNTNVIAAFFFHFWLKSMTTGRKEVYPEEQCLKRGVSLSSDNCKQACWYFLNITNLKSFSRYTGKRDDEQIRAPAIQHHGLASHVHWVGSISFPCPEAFSLHSPLSSVLKNQTFKFKIQPGKTVDKEPLHC